MIQKLCKNTRPLQNMMVLHNLALACSLEDHRKGLHKKGQLHTRVLHTKEPHMMGLGLHMQGPRMKMGRHTWKWVLYTQMKVRCMKNLCHSMCHHKPCPHRSLGLVYLLHICFSFSLFYTCFSFVCKDSFLTQGQVQMLLMPLLQCYSRMQTCHLLPINCFL